MRAFRIKNKNKNNKKKTVENEFRDFNSQDASVNFYLLVIG